MSIFFIIIGFLCIQLATMASCLRIIGGRPTPITTIPWTASLQQNGQHICGATIITNRTLLTAAHCVKPFLVNTLSIRAGSDYHNKNGVVRPVANVSIHSKYSEMTLNYDVALVYTKTPLPFSASVQPIEFATKTDAVEPNRTAIISGWGSVIQDGGASNVLQSATIRVFRRTKCKEIYGTQLRSMMFCAGLMSGVKDACQGDSGGGLIMNEKVAGVVSWGLSCAMKNFPGLYTWVAKLEDWIAENLK